MAITTFAELKTALANWLDRTDLTDYLADYITLAEGHFNRNLRHRKMQAVSDLTPSSNVCTLPTDYLEYIRVVEKVSPRRELSFITPQMVDQSYPSRASGLSNDFTIIGSSLYMYPLSSNDIELTYYQKIPALSDAQTTNWLLSECPELYLRTAQMMALEFENATDTPRFQMVAALAQRLMEELNSQSQMALYAKAQIRLTGPTP